MLRYAAFLLALALTGSAMGQDGNSRLSINTDRPVTVQVDGTILQFESGSTQVVADGLQPGRHEVRVTNAFGTKEFLSTFVEVPAGFEVRCRYKHKQRYFDCYDSVALVVPETTVVVAPVVAAPMVTATVVAPSAPSETTTTTSTTTVSGGVMGMPMVSGSVVVNEGNGGASVGVSVGGMMGGMTVTETTTTSTSTSTSGGVAVVAVEPVAMVLPSKVKLVVRSLDGEWADVVVNGKVELEFRNQEEGIIWVKPGNYTIEIREFMEDEAYAMGRLDTGYADTITLGVKEGESVTCYDHDGWSGR